jgi:hypothetical protein
MGFNITDQLLIRLFRIVRYWRRKLGRNVLLVVVYKVIISRFLKLKAGNNEMQINDSLHCEIVSEPMKHLVGCFEQFLMALC